MLRLFPVFPARNRPLPLVLLAGALSLAACQQHSEAPAPAGTATPAPLPAPSASEAPAPAPTPTTTPTPTPSASPTPSDITDAYRGEKGARGVLLTWARALENGDYGKAWEQFGHGGQDSGSSKALYTARFDKYRRITIAMPTGTMEGAAGSSYYTAPTTLTGELKGGGVEVLRGDVVLRRVNDVPGATSEQLHWHIYQADLKPVG